MALKKIGALWLKEGKKGKFMSGVIQFGEREINILVFKNQSDHPKAPNYTINMPVDDDRQQAEPMRKAFDGEFQDESDIPF